MYVRLQWSEMLGCDIPLRNPGALLRKVKGVMVTDSRSLYDVVHRGSKNTSGLGLKEKYSVLDMLSVLQRLQQGDTVTRWVHSEGQLADAMTKHCVNSALVKVLIHGMWTLVHDETFTSSKNLRKQARMKVHESSVKRVRGVRKCMLLGAVFASTFITSLHFCMMHALFATAAVHTCGALLMGCASLQPVHFPGQKSWAKQANSSYFSHKQHESSHMANWLNS